MQFMKIRLKKNETILISLILVILMALFGFLWKKSSFVTALNELQLKTDAAKTQVLESRALYEKLSKREPAGVGATKEFLDQYVLLNDHFSSVITGIVNSSKGKEFTLTKLSLDDQSSEAGYKKMLYSIDAEASFIDIGKFLEKLEDAPLLTEVSSVEINRIDTEMKRCRAHIKLYSYVRAE